jgi:hypothetical protein
VPIETQARAAVIIRSRVMYFSSPCATSRRETVWTISGSGTTDLVAAGAAISDVWFEAGSGTDTFMVSPTRPASASTPGIGIAATFILAMLPIGFPIGRR